MPPIRELSAWNERRSDSQEQVEPKRKYVFICEGKNTEYYYFKELIAHIEQLKLHPLVDICQWEKTGVDSGRSDPKALIAFAHQQKDSPSLSYSRDLDRVVIVFDADKYCRVGEGRKGSRELRKEFEELLEMKEPDDIYAVTNPSFELFLMLHRRDAFRDIVLPHERELLENRKIGRRRFSQKLFTEEYGINPKTNSAVGELAIDVGVAIEEEKSLNHDIGRSLDVLTSNIGSTIDGIQRYTPEIENLAGLVCSVRELL